MSESPLMIKSKAFALEVIQNRNRRSYGRRSETCYSMGLKKEEALLCFALFH